MCIIYVRMLVGKKKQSGDTTICSSFCDGQTESLHGSQIKMRECRMVKKQESGYGGGARKAPRETFSPLPEISAERSCSALQHASQERQRKWRRPPPSPPPPFSSACINIHTLLRCTRGGIIGGAYSNLDPTSPAVLPARLQHVVGPGPEKQNFSRRGEGGIGVYVLSPQVPDGGNSTLVLNAISSHGSGDLYENQMSSVKTKTKRPAV